MAAYEIDFSDVTSFALGMQELGDGVVVQEARPHWVVMGDAVLKNARGNIKNRSGRMSRSGITQTYVMGNSIETIVNFTALSDGGFPYPVAVEHGRKGFGPVNAKALRFEIGGKVIFAMKVKAAPAQYPMRRGLEQSIPVIVREMQALETTLATKILGAGA